MQLTRSALSVGANYAEANGASSKKDFRNKIHLCKKESLETEYWLKVLESVDAHDTDLLHKLQKESHELTLIFSKIAKSTKLLKIQNSKN